MLSRFESNTVTITSRVDFNRRVREDLRCRTRPAIEAAVAIGSEVVTEIRERKTGKSMAKYTRNNGKPITAAVVTQVRQLARENTPTRVIGLKTGRTENSVRAIASEHGISLKPTNQSPYGSGKK
jgi:hypothetical protein